MKWENWYKEIINYDEEGTETSRELQAPPQNKQTESGGWIINYNRSADLMTADGYREWTDAELEAWHSQYDPPAPVYVRQRCTKYQLVTCLKTYYTDLLATLRTAYAGSADLQFYWNTVNDLDKTNADFKTAQAALGITDEQVTEIFSKIEGDEPSAVEG